MADIFMSYAREDVGTATRLAAALERHGWSVFWDRRIPAGCRFDQFIAEQLEVAHCVIVLWSKAAVCSEWVVEEAANAKERNVLAPALIDTVRPPFGFRHRQCADLVGWPQEGSHPGFQQLVEDITQLCGLPQKNLTEGQERQRAGAEAKRKTEEEVCYEANEQERPRVNEGASRKNGSGGSRAKALWLAFAVSRVFLSLILGFFLAASFAGILETTGLITTEQAKLGSHMSWLLILVGTFIVFIVLVILSKKWLLKSRVKS